MKSKPRPGGCARKNRPNSPKYSAAPWPSRPSTVSSDAGRVQPPDQLGQVAGGRLVAAAVAVAAQAPHQQRPLVRQLARTTAFDRDKALRGVGEAAELGLAQPTFFVSAGANVPMNRP